MIVQEYDQEGLYLDFIIPMDKPIRTCAGKSDSGTNPTTVVYAPQVVRVDPDPDIGDT